MHRHASAAGVALAALLAACASSSSAPPAPAAPTAQAATTEQPTARQSTAAAGIDSARAAGYFAEAKVLCEREGGSHWGVSLCGPIVIADAPTKSIATNAPAPSAPRPAALGYANAAMQWGDTRWTTLVWQHMASAAELPRQILVMHELFHRIQPQLGLLLPEPSNDHLDTFAGRVWMQLEWRALAAALVASGAERNAALADALSFRAARHRAAAAAAENERVLEINEGLPQYTGTVAALPVPDAARADAVRQLHEAARSPSFVRTFAYPSGTAYGVLLDVAEPGWTRRLMPTGDLAVRLASAMKLEPATDVEAAAARYGVVELRAAEERRAAAHAAVVAGYRARFVEGPVLRAPRGKSASFVTNGMTPIDSAGTIYPTYRTTTDWGSLDATYVLLSSDGQTIVVPAPVATDATTISGEGYTIRLAPGWVVRPGTRSGDFELVRRAGDAGSANP